MRNPSTGHSLLALLLATVVSGPPLACGGDDPDGGPSSGGDTGGADGGVGPAPMDGLFTDAVTEVVLEIDYETGAAPATGGLLDFGDPWDLFITNAEAIFAEHPRTLVVPTELSEMQALPDLAETDFTVAEILDVAEQYRDETSTAGRRTFYVVWLDGYFEDDTGRRDTVLGVSLGDTGVIAMFKPVIGTGPLRTRVEQTTLVHEFGHAVGLVNNGVPLTTDHHDEAHGAHCDNPDCVMYWTVEGPDIADFVQARVTNSGVVLFGEECRDDLAGAATSR